MPRSCDSSAAGGGSVDGASAAFGSEAASLGTSLFSMLSVVVGRGCSSVSSSSPPGASSSLNFLISSAVGAADSGAPGPSSGLAGVPFGCGILGGG